MTEAAVLEDVFGAKIKTIPVVSVKSMIRAYARRMRSN